MGQCYSQDDAAQAELSMSSSPEADSRLPLRGAGGAQTVHQTQPSNPPCRGAGGHPAADVIPEPAQVRAAWHAPALFWAFRVSAWTLSRIC